ncbi:MAG: penicillin-binding transpeptidase domain-containing protein [Anaerovoracaceae bacterium]
MTRPLNKSKKRLIIAFAIFYGVMIILCFRVGWVQIVRGKEYSQKATEQQTSDVPIEAKRGAIYDTNGKELAVSATCYTLWARPANVAQGINKEERQASIEKAVTALGGILKNQDENEIRKMLTKRQALVKVDKYLDKETADKLREANISGIEIAEDVKRYYPEGPFIAHTLGSVTNDNNGLSGLELEYNRELRGSMGKWKKNPGSHGDGLSSKDESYQAAEDGLSLVLTIDNVIQHYVEKSLATVQKNTSADRVMCIMMEPKTGNILALAQTPDFDPNDSKVPLSKKEAAEVESLPDKKKLEYWNKMWRNSLISDVYEPGSTFKLLTTSMALEQGKTKLSDHFTCTGSINVSGTTLKCWRSARPHGTQTLKEAVGNSCNPVFVQLAGRMGIDRYYGGLHKFGVGSKTGVDFPGEGNSILQNKDAAGPVGLATMGYGQGVAVTPIQLVTAVSALGNGGKLMEPRLVKSLIDEKGRDVKIPTPKVESQAVSEKTADEMREIMEYVVAKGGAGTAKVSGYRVGGKTGTANKAEGGGYSEQTYSSFIGMAPMDDPKVTVLVIVDNPKGVKFGSQTAAPGAKMILEDTLKYLEVKPILTKADKKKKVTVPDLKGEGLEEAIGILGGLSLNYKIEDGKENKDFIIKSQYPKAGVEIGKTGTVYLYKE